MCVCVIQSVCVCAKGGKMLFHFVYIDNIAEGGKKRLEIDGGPFLRVWGFLASNE